MNKLLKKLREFAYSELIEPIDIHIKNMLK